MKEQSKKMSKLQPLKTRIKFAFTLLEVLIAAAVALVLLTVLYSTFISSNKSYRTTVNQAELAQNGRIALERISRDIRQSSDIVTVLPATDGIPLNPPPNHILFRDGHYTTGVRYIEYSLDGTLLRRKVIHYAFSSSPSVWVIWNAQDAYGNSPPPTEDKNEIKADKIGFLKFYGADNIAIDLSVTDSNYTFYFKTKALARNLWNKRLTL